MTMVSLLGAEANLDRPACANGMFADVDAQFFALWADRSVSHSAAMFQDGDDLHSAQARKNDYLLSAAGCHTAHRVLDIGCGWGAALERMVTHFNVHRPVGLAASPTQAEWVRAHRPARIRVRAESWQEHESVASYDAIISVGALEQLCKIGWSNAQRSAMLRLFFEKCRRWLKAGRRMALQTVVQGSRGSDRPLLADLPLTSTRTSEESSPARIGEIVDAAYGLFEIVRLRNDPDHYIRTCDEWAMSLARCRHAAVALVGSDTVAHYERSLHRLRDQFEGGHTGLARVVLQAI